MTLWPLSPEKKKATPHLPVLVVPHTLLTPPAPSASTPLSRAGPTSSSSSATGNTHGSSSGRPGGPGQRALKSLLPQGFVLGEVAGKLHEGVGAPALRFHQLPQGHGARQGGRVGAKPPPGLHLVPGRHKHRVNARRSGRLPRAPGAVPRPGCRPPAPPAPAGPGALRGAGRVGRPGRSRPQAGARGGGGRAQRQCRHGARSPAGSQRGRAQLPRPGRAAAAITPGSGTPPAPGFLRPAPARPTERTPARHGRQGRGLPSEPRAPARPSLPAARAAVLRPGSPRPGGRRVQPEPGSLPNRPPRPSTVPGAAGARGAHGARGRGQPLKGQAPRERRTRAP